MNEITTRRGSKTLHMVDWATDGELIYTEIHRNERTGLAPASALEAP